MAEIDGIVAAMRAAGEKIERLESDCAYERICKENLAAEVKRISEENRKLTAENQALNDKLGRVEEFVEKNAPRVD